MVSHRYALLATLLLASVAAGQRSPRQQQSPPPPPYGLPPGPPPVAARGQPPSPPPGVPRPPADRETLRDLEQLLTDGQYRAVIEKADARLAERSPGHATGPIGYEQARLLLLKGEALLQLRQQAKAAEAFDRASKTLVTDLRHEATAAALLIERSRNFGYAPRTRNAGATTADPIDVLTNRKRAMAALYRDELADVAPQVTAARPPRTLPQVFQVLKTTEPLRAVEHVATGGTTESAALLEPVAEQARRLMTDAMAGMEPQIADARERANRETQTVHRGRIHMVKAGLRNSDRKALESIAETCDTIAQASGELGPMFPTGGDTFQATRAEAERLSRAAYEVLNHNYAQRVDTGKPAR
jgi:hypothetical protein